MTNHDACKKMAKAWKHLRMAEATCASGIVIDNIRIAADFIYEVGEEKFCKEFADEIKQIHMGL